MRRSAVTGSLLYRDAPAAIERPPGVFGFEKRAIYPGENNTILHPELTLGGGMIPVASFGDGPFRRHMKHPDEIGGCGAGSVNLVVEDANAAQARESIGRGNRLRYQRQVLPAAAGSPAAIRKIIHGMRKHDPRAPE